MSAIPLSVHRGLAAVPRGDRHGLGRLFRRARATVREWRRRVRDREALAALDQRMLKDIGLTPAEALFIASKPFWRE